MGPEFAQIHLVRPHKYSICLQGHLIRMHSSGLLTTLERHWYAVANGILYEYTPRKVRQAAEDVIDGPLFVYVT